MTTYFCKCGRQVKKAANADNTGNRDTEGCAGCPYLLPWGPFVWDEARKDFIQDVKGHECRMSPTINYATTYRGQANDKCTLHIVSMDLDFLEKVQAWIYDNAADTLTAGFSSGSMRAVDFSDQGRYSLSISCAQNKKGMAAKAALLDRFFTAGRVRRDMSPAQEKAHILAVIKKGREQAQGKDTTMKKQNDRCPLQQECERTCKMIGHERDCDYYVNNRHGTGGIPDQDKILTVEERKKVREREEQYLASLSDKPSDPVTYQNEYGTLFAVREHKGAPSLMCKAKGADSWVLSGVLAAVQGEAYTAADLQEVLDEYALAHGWQKAAPDADENPTFSRSATAAENQSADIQATLHSDNMTVGDVASDCAPVGPVAENTAVSPHSAFDYTGLDDQTVTVLHLAEREIREARQTYICRVSAAVASAHDELVANCEGHNQHSDDTFIAWCRFVGIRKDTAYRLLQVNNLLTGATAEEQATLEAASPSLLYAAAKPSAPAELVQAVKAGDITTHKQYQEALAEIRARDAKIKDLLEMSEAADRRAEEEERKRKEAEKKVKGLADSYATAHKNEEFSIRNLKKAQQERDEAIKERDGARDALKAVKMRADKWQAEAEAAKAKPIEAKVVDEAEVNRRAQELADKQTADLRQRLADLQATPSDAEEADRDAYDAAVYTCRTIENSWNAVKPLLQRMAPDTLPMAANQLATVLHNIENEVRACL